jgi:hypothetical protein
MNWRESPQPVRAEQSLLPADAVSDELAKLYVDLSAIELLPADHPLKTSYEELIDVNVQNQQLLDDILNVGEAPEIRAFVDLFETGDFRGALRHPFQVVKGAWTGFMLLRDPEANRLMFGQPRAFTNIGFGYYQDGIKLAIVRQMAEDHLRSRTIDEMTDDAEEMLARVSAGIDKQNGIRHLRREDLSEAPSSEARTRPFRVGAFTHSKEYLGVEDFIKSLAASISQYDDT